MKKTNPSGPALFSRTVRALGRSWVLVASTIAVGSGRTPSSFAANASASQASKSSIVADNGPGIPAEELPHVFDRYYQAQRKNRDGIGLGLSIARGIVEAHGGRIWVDSPTPSAATSAREPTKTTQAGRQRMESRRARPGQRLLLHAPDRSMISSARPLPHWPPKMDPYT